MKRMRKTAIIPLCISLLCSACLKTRTQLRDEGPDEGRSVPATQVQDVQPSGQYAIEELKSELTQLVGRVDELERNHRESAKNQGNQAEIKHVEDRMSAMEQKISHFEESLEKLQGNPALVNADELFQKAKAQFEDEEYEAASNSFATYLKIPKGKHIEEATYLRAESYFKLKQYKKAIVDYSKFPEKFKQSSRMPVALYKIGLSFEALGMKEDANGFFQELVEKYPKSSEAKKARKKVK